MIDYYDLEVSEVFIYSNFLVNQIKEGQSIQPTHIASLDTIVNDHYKDRELIYISNRIYSYAVNPLIYIEVSKIENLVAMAIVVHNEESRKTAEFERSFYTKPFEIFDTLAEAVSWSQSKLKNM